MPLYFGTAVRESHTGTVTVASLAAYQDMSQPAFSHILPYNDIKKTFLALTFVSNTSAVKAINASSHRLIEQLLYKKILDPGTPLHAKLLMRREYRTLSVTLPIEDNSRHWLINAADNALHLWLRGIR